MGILRQAQDDERRFYDAQPLDSPAALDASRVAVCGDDSAFLVNPVATGGAALCCRGVVSRLPLW